MAESGESLKIFLCYRREETRYAARALAQAIKERVADAEIFMDVDRSAIQIGENWRRRIERAIDASDVVIALIGDQWLKLEAADGRRKLDNPIDPVRLELERALERALLVIPVRLDEARMPNVDELPESLWDLVSIHGAELRHSRYDDDVEELIESIEKLRPELEQKRLAREATREQLEEQEAVAEPAAPQQSRAPQLEVEPEDTSVTVQTEDGADQRYSVTAAVMSWSASLVRWPRVLIPAGAAALVLVLVIVLLVPFGDTRAPRLEPSSSFVSPGDNTELNPVTVFLFFDEELAVERPPATSLFNVTASGRRGEVAGARMRIRPNLIVLDLAPGSSLGLEPNIEVTVSYDPQPGVAGIEDESGNETAAFTADLRVEES